jgi:hypothetical protein
MLRTTWCITNVEQLITTSAAMTSLNVGAKPDSSGVSVVSESRGVKSTTADLKWTLGHRKRKSSIVVDSSANLNLVLLPSTSSALSSVTCRSLRLSAPASVVRSRPLPALRSRSAPSSGALLEAAAYVGEDASSRPVGARER